MGWDSASNWNKKADAVKSIQSDLESNGWTILDKASTRQGAYFAVTKDSESFIYCAMVESRQGEIWVKTFSEAAGPSMTDCPLKLLAYPSTAGSYATKWREDVKAFHSMKNRDLSGKLIDLYGKKYSVSTIKQGRSYIAVDETGKKYRMSKRQESQALILN